MARDLSSAVVMNHRFEGLGDGDKKTPGLQPYQCPAGVWTIGRGHAIHHPSEGRLLNKPEDKELACTLYPSMSEEEADALLMNEDLPEYAEHVERLVRGHDLNDNQFCALLDFCYNAGVGALQTLLSHGINDVPNQLPRWNHYVGPDGVKRESEWQTKRRAAEVALWNEAIK